MADDPTILRWLYPHGERGPHFALVRLREPDEPETIGSVQLADRSRHADRRHVWSWSMSCHLIPVGIEPAATATSGTEDSKRAACEALLAAWRVETAWRETVRARPDFESLPGSTRDFVVNGQPTPARWAKGRIYNRPQRSIDSFRGR